jgi:hypothetical protein
MESLIGLCLTLAILLASFGFFSMGRRVFFKLKSAEEDRLAAMAALAKIRSDLAQAGGGLETPMALGLISGLEISGAKLSIMSLDDSLTPIADLDAGSSRLFCAETPDVAKGRIVCLHDNDKGEIQIAEGSGQGYILCATPFRNSYKKEEVRILIVGSVDYYLDKAVIRRKANASSAQPLLEEVETWEVEAGGNRNLVRFGLRLKGKERLHEMSVFAKNMALARSGK